MSDWPEHTQELSRKSAELLARWVEANDAGTLSDATFLLLVTAMIDTVAGLVERDFQHLLGEIHQALTVSARGSRAKKPA